MQPKPIPDPSRPERAILETSQPLPGDLVRVLEWLRERLSEPVQLEQLAQIAGVRPRTLEAHSRSFLGTTPLGWVRRTRLVLARQRLLNPRHDATVTDIAVASGISQLGRFTSRVPQGLWRGSFGDPQANAAATGRCRRDGRGVAVYPEGLAARIRGPPERVQRGIGTAEPPRSSSHRPIGLPRAVAAWCWGQRASHQLSSTADADRDRSCRLAEEAYNCLFFPHDALTVTLSSGALVLAHHLEEADRRLERALALDPWLAYVWIRRGWMSAYLGDIDSALRELRTALHLAPL